MLIRKIVRKIKIVLRNIFQNTFVSSKHTEENIKTIGGITQSEIITAAGFSDYFEYTKQSQGCDHTCFGDWQIGYSQMMEAALGLNGKKVLDIGCAAGATVYGFSLANADAYGCDINSSAIKTTPFPIKSKLSVIETSEIAEHYYDKKFDIFHSQQVFEHFPGKEYSEKVVESLFKVTTQDVIGYIALIAGEHKTQEELILAKDDITHINIWPLGYWRSLFANTGFSDVSEWFCPIIMCYQMKKNNFSFYKEYNWDQFFITKCNIDAKKIGIKRLIDLLEIQKNYADIKIYETVINDNRTNNELRSIITRYM